MKSTFITIIIVTLYLTSLSLHAESICYKRGHTINVCDEAKKISNELSSRFPMKMSENIIAEKVAAYDNNVIISIFLNYDEKYLSEEARKGGVTISYLKAKMQAHMKNYICTTNSKWFIENGGQITYVYRFYDGVHFMDVVVDNCKN